MEKLYVKPSDLETLGKGGYMTCLNLYKKIKKHYNKSKFQELTVYEYCDFMKEDIEVVKKHLGFIN